MQQNKVAIGDNYFENNVNTPKKFYHAPTNQTSEPGTQHVPPYSSVLFKSYPSDRCSKDSDMNQTLLLQKVTPKKTLTHENVAKAVSLPPKEAYNILDNDNPQAYKNQQSQMPYPYSKMMYGQQAPVDLTNMGIQTSLSDVSTSSHVFESEYTDSFDHASHTMLYPTQKFTQPFEPYNQSKFSTSADPYPREPGDRGFKNDNALGQLSFYPYTTGQLRQYQAEHHDQQSNSQVAEATFNTPKKFRTADNNQDGNRQMNQSLMSYSNEPYKSPKTSRCFNISETMDEPDRFMVNVQNTYTHNQNVPTVTFNEAQLTNDCIKIYKTVTQSDFKQSPSYNELSSSQDRLADANNTQVNLPIAAIPCDPLSSDNHAEIVIKFPMRRSFV